MAPIVDDRYGNAAEMMALAHTRPQLGCPEGRVE